MSIKIKLKKKKKRQYRKLQSDGNHRRKAGE